MYLASAGALACATPGAQAWATIPDAGPSTAVCAQVCPPNCWTGRAASRKDACPWANRSSTGPLYRTGPLS